MIRVTTNGSLHSYKSNLMQSTNLLNNAMTKLMTQRNFNSYAADPAAATRAFKLHSSLNSVNAQLSNNQTIKNKYNTAWSTMDIIINDLSDKLGKVPALKGLNGTNLTNLNSQGQILRNGAEAMIQSMNAKYDDDFLFAGADSQNAPFAIDADGYITYRGVYIDKDLDQIYHDADGNPMLDENGNEMTNQQVLDKWNNEHQYVDIGLGFGLDADGNVLDSTAFDAAISGIEIMGYGVDEDGDPKNLASIMLRLADIFENFNEDAGNDNGWASPQDKEDAYRLLDKFNQAQEAMSQQHSSLYADAKFLNTNETQLKDTFDSLNVERGALEDIDTVDVIMELSWAQMCYNAALQVGTNVIPQSLMDYMK